MEDFINDCEKMAKVIVKKVPVEQHMTFLRTAAMKSLVEEGCIVKGMEKDTENMLANMQGIIACMALELVKNILDKKREEK